MGGAGAPSGNIKELEKHLEQVAKIIIQHDCEQINLYLSQKDKSRECEKI